MSEDCAKIRLVTDLDEAAGLAARLKKLYGRNIDASASVQESLERFTPMLPLLIPRDGGAMAFCARCRQDLSQAIIDRGSYCPSCGQFQAEPLVTGGHIRVFPTPDCEGSLKDG